MPRGHWLITHGHAAWASKRVRHVLYVREGALPSKHTIPTLSLFPCFKYKHSKNKMLRVLQMVQARRRYLSFFSGPNYKVSVRILTRTRLR